MMSNITVCARFRPLSTKERKDSCDSICISSIDSESFIFKVKKPQFLSNFLHTHASKQALVCGIDCCVFYRMRKMSVHIALIRCFMRNLCKLMCMNF
jgi:hypothetical protein